MQDQAKRREQVRQAVRRWRQRWPGMIARALRGDDPHVGQLDDLRPIVE